jgi:hypothetical protein
MADLMARFLEAYGSPNHFGNPERGSEGIVKGHLFTMGVRDYLAIHWEEVNYILSFGASLLEASRPSLRNLWGYGYFRIGRPGRRGKLVQVEPRFSVTASKSDEWVPIRPGTDGALALAIAHWIIKEKRYDQDFINHYTFGFDDWKGPDGKTRMGFKTLVLNQYSPKTVSLLTGISEEIIVKVAQEFSSHRPSIAISGEGWACRRMGLILRWPLTSQCPDGIDRRSGASSSEKPLRNGPLSRGRNCCKGFPRIDGAGSCPSFCRRPSSVLPERLERGLIGRYLFFTIRTPLQHSKPKDESFEKVLSSSASRPSWMNRPL